MNKLAKGLIEVFLKDYRQFIPNKLKNRYKLDLEFIVRESTNSVIEEDRKKRFKNKNDVIGL